MSLRPGPAERGENLVDHSTGETKSATGAHRGPVDLAAKQEHGATGPKPCGRRAQPDGEAACHDTPASFRPSSSPGSRRARSPAAKSDVTPTSPANRTTSTSSTTCR